MHPLKATPIAPSYSVVVPPPPVTVETSLDQYYKVKQFIFDAAHEINRTKDLLLTRALNAHEVRTHQREILVGALSEELAGANVSVSKAQAELKEYTDTNTVLNKALLHYTNDEKQTSGASQELHFELLKRTAIVCSADKALVEATKNVGAVAIGKDVLHSKDATILLLNGQVEVLQRAMQLLIRKGEAALELKADIASEFLVEEACADLLNSKTLSEDEYLQSICRERKTHLSRMLAFEKEIEFLKRERSSLTNSLRKAEQEVIQMRLKMMERDSGMALAKKRMKAVEGQLEEETTTSLSRIEAAERLAGDLTYRYEIELRKARETVDEYMRRIAEALKTVELHKKQVEQAREDTAEAQRQGVQAVEDTEIEVRRVCKITENEITALLTDMTRKRDLLLRHVSTLELTTREQSDKIIELQEKLAAAESEIGMLNGQKASLLSSLQERNKGALQFLSERMLAKRGSKAICDVEGLISNTLASSSSMTENCTATDSNLRRLSSRFIKLSAFKDTDKAQHPKISERVDDALQQLAAGMIAISQQSPKSGKRTKIANMSPVDETTKVEKKKSKRKTEPDGLSASANPVQASPKHRDSKTRSPKEREPDAADIETPSSAPVQSVHRKSAAIISLTPEILAEAHQCNTPSANISDDSDDDDNDSVATPTLTELGDDFQEEPLVFRPQMCDAEIQTMAKVFTDKSIMANLDGPNKKGGMPPQQQQSVQQRSGSSQFGSTRLGESTNTSNRESSGGTDSTSPQPQTLQLPSASTPMNSALVAGPVAAGSVAGPGAPKASFSKILSKPPLPLPQKAAAPTCAKTESYAYIPVTDDELTTHRAAEDLEALSRQLIMHNETYILSIIMNKIHRTIIEAKKAATKLHFDACEQQICRKFSSMHNLLAGVKETQADNDAEAAAKLIHLTALSASQALPQVERETFEAVDVIQEDDSVTADQYNQLVHKYGDMRKKYDYMVLCHELHTVAYEKVLEELELSRSYQSAERPVPLFEYSKINDATGAKMSPQLSPRGVRIKSDQQISEWLNSVYVFLLEAQRYVGKVCLPDGQPFMFEDRPLMDIGNAQDKMGVLLDCMKTQRDNIVAEKKKKKKKKASSNASTTGSEPCCMADVAPEEDDGFLHTPEDGDALDEDAGMSAFSKKLVLTPRKGKTVAMSVQRVVSDDDEDAEEEESAPKVRPVIPRLKFPVNLVQERMAIDAVLQPLVAALKKKLVAHGMEKLIDPVERVGMASAFETGMDDPVRGSGMAKALLETRVRGLRAVLSFETGSFLFQDHHMQLLSQMFNSFPKHLIQRVSQDFDLEFAYELVVRTAKWWDTWSPIATTFQEDVGASKPERIQRMIELCELLDSSEVAIEAQYGDVDERSPARTENTFSPFTAPNRDVVELLHARGRRHNEGMVHKLDHPQPLDVFSLQSRVKVAPVHDPSVRAHGAFSKAVRMKKEDPFSGIEATPTTAFSVIKQPPVPAVASLQSPINWNPNAKKMGSRWEELKNAASPSPPPKKLPPLM